MTQQEMSLLIRESATDFRNIKTRSNKIRKKYSTREQKAGFIAFAEAKQRFLVEQVCNHCLVEYGVYPLTRERFTLPPRPLSRADEDFLILAIFFVQTAELTLWVLDTVRGQAVKEGKDPVEAGFDMWLEGRILGPLYRLGLAMVGQFLPESLRERAVGIVSGCAESDTNLKKNIPLRKGLEAKGGDPIEALRRFLPVASLEGWSDLALRHKPDLLQNIHDALKVHEAERRPVLSLNALTESGWEPASQLPSPEQIVETKDLAREARRRLDDLPERQRLTYEYIEIKEYSYKETADLLGISVDGVKTNLRKAREKIFGSA